MIRVATLRESRTGTVTLLVLLPPGVELDEKLVQQLVSELTNAVASPSPPSSPSPLTLPLPTPTSTRASIRVDETDSLVTRTTTTLWSSGVPDTTTSTNKREENVTVVVESEGAGREGRGQHSTMPTPHTPSTTLESPSPRGDFGSLDTKAPDLTRARSPATIPPQPDFAFKGYPLANSKGERGAPRECIMGPNALTWAQGVGFRGDWDWLAQTVDECLDYWRSTGGKNIDWQATIRNGVRRAVQRETDIPPRLVGTNGQGTAQQQPYARGGNDGQRQRGTGYGYDRAGNPTNRATATRAETAKLEALLKQRAGLEPDGVGDDPGPDVISLDPDEWRGV